MFLSCFFTYCGPALTVQANVSHGVKLLVHLRIQWRRHAVFMLKTRRSTTIALSRMRKLALRKRGLSV